jgi:hypothetical protein
MQKHKWRNTFVDLVFMMGIFLLGFGFGIKGNPLSYAILLLGINFMYIVDIYLVYKKKYANSIKSTGG